MRDEINQLLSIKVTVYLPFSFQKKKKRQQNKIWHPRKSPNSFLAPKVPVLTKTKATNSVLSFLGNLFINKLFRLAITFAREVCHLMMKKNMTIVLFFSLSIITALVGVKQRPEIRG